MGNATVVLLNAQDRLELNSALNTFAAENELSMSNLAKKIGVNRTYLYSLLDANQIELSRLIKIQNLIDFQIISEADAHLYIRNLWHSITARSFEPDWLNLCEYVLLDAYYVKRFLLPAMVQEVGNLHAFYSTGEALEPETVLPSFAVEAYLVSLAESYFNSAINSLGGEYGHIDEQFYENPDGESDQLRFVFPVFLNSSTWLDIFEVAHELIFDYHSPTEETDQTTLKSYQDKYARAYPEMSDDEASRYYSDLEFLRVMECHSKAEELIKERSARIDDWANTISEYCAKEKRVLRRQFCFPLELKAAAENPSLYTLPIIESRKETDIPVK